MGSSIDLLTTRSEFISGEVEAVVPVEVVVGRVWERVEVGVG